MRRGSRTSRRLRSKNEEGDLEAAIAARDLAHLDSVLQKLTIPIPHDTIYKLVSKLRPVEHNPVEHNPVEHNPVEHNPVEQSTVENPVADNEQHAAASSLSGAASLSNETPRSEANKATHVDLTATFETSFVDLTADDDGPSGVDLTVADNGSSVASPCPSLSSSPETNAKPDAKLDTKPSINTDMETVEPPTSPNSKRESLTFLQVMQMQGSTPKPAPIFVPKVESSAHSTGLSYGDVTSNEHRTPVPNESPANKQISGDAKDVPSIDGKVSDGDAKLYPDSALQSVFQSLPFLGPLELSTQSPAQSTQSPAQSTQSPAQSTQSPAQSDGNSNETDGSGNGQLQSASREGESRLIVNTSDEDVGHEDSNGEDGNGGDGNGGDGTGGDGNGRVQQKCREGVTCPEDYDVLERLLEAKGDANATAKECGVGWNPCLMVAIANKCEPVVSLLLSHNANPHMKDSRKGQTALMIAVQADSIPLVKQMLQLTPEAFNQRCKTNWLPIHWARSSPMLAFLIDKGADINVCGGKSSLMNDRITLLDWLIGADPLNPIIPKMQQYGALMKESIDLIAGIDPLLDGSRKETEKKRIIKEQWKWCHEVIEQAKRTKAEEEAKAKAEEEAEAQTGVSSRKRDRSSSSSARNATKRKRSRLKRQGLVSDGSTRGSDGPPIETVERAPTDTKCEFCQVMGDGPHGEGPLLTYTRIYCGQRSTLHAHAFCAELSPKVIQPVEGQSKIETMLEEADRALKNLCSCFTCSKKKGAVMGCAVQDCNRVFHLNCAAKSGCVMSISSMRQGQWALYCRQHRETCAGVAADFCIDWTKSFRSNVLVPPPDPKAVRDRKRKLTAVGIRTLQRFLENQKALKKRHGKRKRISDDVQKYIANGRVLELQWLFENGVLATSEYLVAAIHALIATRVSEGDPGSRKRLFLGKRDEESLRLRKRGKVSLQDWDDEKGAEVVVARASKLLTFPKKPDVYFPNNFLAYERTQDPRLRFILPDGPLGGSGDEKANGRTSSGQGLRQQRAAVAKAKAEAPGVPDDVCTESQRMDVIKLLLEHKASPNTPGISEKPLLLAAEHDCVDLIRLLVSHNAYLGQMDSSRRNALALAAWKAAHGAMRALYAIENELKTTTDAKDAKLTSGTRWKSTRRKSRAATCLDDRFVSQKPKIPLLQMQDNDGFYPIHWAKTPSSIDTLVDLKADVNLKDRRGSTLLQWAMYDYRPALLLHLLETHKCDVNTLDVPKLTPTLSASAKACVQISRAFRGSTDDISYGREARPIPTLDTLTDNPASQADGDSKGAKLPLFEYVCLPEFHESVKANRHDDRVRQNGLGIHTSKHFGTEEWQLRHDCSAVGCRCGSLPAHLRALGQRHGVTHKLYMRHFERKGWGVCSEERIKKGSFVSVYAGEIISHREKCLREEHSETSVTYIIDAQVGPKWAHMIIDGGRKGNISRFFNHSCDPNLKTKLIVVDGYRKPMLAYFATRDIVPGEELCWSYNVGGRHERMIACHCGSARCKSWL